MSLAFTNPSWWLWNGKQKEPKLKNDSSVNSSTDLNLWELDSVMFPSIIGGNVASTSRRVKRRSNIREERKIDTEHDLVLVPSDGGWISDSESDDSDWSIGWSEPHAPDFQSDDENDCGFGVLVPCYRHGHGDVAQNTNKIVGTIVSIPDRYSAEGKKYMEQWLSSLQNS
ncbi:hypothetical protein Nepgr_024169 [Nepenthes gracilis]|uniref:Uncharacterized protein n=1 Tax=Nepenthes gracilis TaxID=150966 RepID=A0AAD3T5L8_NEPGR|nr:hypothetical protein Nepgr_024169 [Nepenthes gracilis]